MTGGRADGQSAGAGVRARRSDADRGAEPAMAPVPGRSLARSG